MEPDESELYISEILSRKKRYEKDIALRLGFEVDFPLFGTFDKKYFNDPRIDYLIGSCHFLDGWAFDHPDHTDEFDKRNIDDVYGQYYSHISDLARAGLFNIVGHFDLVKKFGHRPKKDFSKTIESITVILSRNDLAVEINTAGLLKPVNEIYPSREIIEILYNKNVPVTIGSDAHEPGNVSYMIFETIEMLKKIGYRAVSGFKNKKRYDIPL